MGSVFGDESAAVAIIDRFLHYSTTVNIRSESYRIKARKKAGRYLHRAAGHDGPSRSLRWGISNRRSDEIGPELGNLRPALTPVVDRTLEPFQPNPPPPPLRGIREVWLTKHFCKRGLKPAALKRRYV
ncbi:MAG TPA: ATP-binding protein [Candidatus Dormibacteraeota bacterium]